MNYLAVIAAILLLGGGGAVAGAVYVGEVDWDAYFSDGIHTIDEHRSRVGGEFTIINIEPVLASDGQYY